MSCTAEPRELITFWLAGSLSPEDAALVSRHVESCAECREAAMDAVILLKGLRELHLTAEEVVAAAAGDLHSPHVLVCARCRDDVALLRDVNVELERGARDSSPQTTPGTRRHWRTAALAALAAGVAFVAVFLAPHRTEDPSVLRGGPSSTVALLPVAIDAGGVPTFAWSPVSGSATRYRVSLFSEDGRPVFSREVPASPLRWPDEVPRTAGAYRFRVEALAGNTVAARSRLAELEITR